MKTISADDYLGRAIAHWKAKTGTQASESMSRVEQDRVILENVNGVLAEYFFDMTTDKITCVVTFANDGTAITLFERE